MKTVLKIAAGMGAAGLILILTISLITGKTSLTSQDLGINVDQLENGVGMLRLLHNEFTEALAAEQGDNEVRELSLATGKLAYPTICTLMEQMKEKFPDTTVHVYPIRNDFFGERITVSGLVTGQDLTAQLKGQKLEFENLGMTRMACPEMQYEDAFVKMLDEVDGYEIKGEELKFYDDKKLLAEFRAVQDAAAQKK